MWKVLPFVAYKGPYLVVGYMADVEGVDLWGLQRTIPCDRRYGRCARC